MNPFLQDMQTLKLPDGMGTTLSIGGFSVEADEDNCITVPRQYVNDLMYQGLTKYTAPVKADKKDK